VTAAEGAKAQRIVKSRSAGITAGPRGAVKLSSPSRDTTTPVGEIANTAAITPVMVCITPIPACGAPAAIGTTPLGTRITPIAIGVTLLEIGVMLTATGVKLLAVGVMLSSIGVMRVAIGVSFCAIGAMSAALERRHPCRPTVYATRAAGVGPPQLRLRLSRLVLPALVVPGALRRPDGGGPRGFGGHGLGRLYETFVACAWF
jgi:hypothetical protein